MSTPNSTAVFPRSEADAAKARGMRHTVKLPKLGDTADEVVVIEWLADVGDRIEVSDPVLRVETSKVDTEVVSPVGGIVLEHLVRPGDEVSVGAPIIVVESA